MCITLIQYMLLPLCGTYMYVANIYEHTYVQLYMIETELTMLPVCIRTYIYSDTYIHT